jgi:hypothetical protein
MDAFAVLLKTFALVGLVGAVRAISRAVSRGRPELC